MSAAIAMGQKTPTGLYILKDKNPETGEETIEYADLNKGKFYSDPEGLKLKFQMSETDMVMEDHAKPMLSKGRNGNPGRPIHAAHLVRAAANHYYTHLANDRGEAQTYVVADERNVLREYTARPRSVALTHRDGVIRDHRVAETRDKDGRKVELRDSDGRLVLMDLAPQDVHTAATLSTYGAGYRIADGVADIVSPPVLVDKATDVYYTANADNDFKRRLPNSGAPGAASPEVNPLYSPATYSATQFTIGGFLPTEVMANADSPLTPLVKLTQMCVDGYRLEREIAIAALAQTSGNFNSTLVQTLTTGLNWDGGGASDPMFVLHAAQEASYMDITDFVWSELVHHAYVRNPAVQKYIYAKNGVSGIPDLAAISREFGLPPITVARMKYQLAGGATYVWGKHVTAIRKPAEMPPKNGMDIGTFLTFRWIGGTAPDGQMTSGLLVRTYYDQTRGGRGGTKVVVVVNDANVSTSANVGGLILNAHS